MHHIQIIQVGPPRKAYAVVLQKWKKVNLHEMNEIFLRNVKIGTLKYCYS